MNDRWAYLLVMVNLYRYPEWLELIFATRDFCNRSHNWIVDNTFALLYVRTPELN